MDRTCGDLGFVILGPLPSRFSWLLFASGIRVAGILRQGDPGSVGRFRAWGRGRAEAKRYVRLISFRQGRRFHPGIVAQFFVLDSDFPSIIFLTARYHLSG